MSLRRSSNPPANVRRAAAALPACRSIVPSVTRASTRASWLRVDGPGHPPDLGSPRSARLAPMAKTAPPRATPPAEPMRLRLPPQEIVPVPHRAWRDRLTARHQPGCRPEDDGARLPSRLRFSPKLASVAVGVEQGLLHDVRWVDLGPTAVAKLKLGQHPQIAAKSFRHKGCGIDRLGHDSPPHSLATIGPVTGRAATAIFSTSNLRRMT